MYLTGYLCVASMTRASIDTHIKLLQQFLFLLSLLLDHLFSAQVTLELPLAKRSIHWITAAILAELQILLIYYAILIQL